MRWIAATAVVALVMGWAGCGDDETKRAPRAQDRPPTRAEIERFGRIQLPASASDVQAKAESGMDSSMFVSFAMKRGDLQTFIDAANFTEPPREGRRALTSDAELGWKIDDIKSLLGHSELQTGLGRRIVIDLDDPQRPIAYFVASTI